ncbi:MAG: prolyl oligopeptidase family serine peptidase, partial [Victivallales bacterium]|nr:prolyl oligopeptidase family serine peptidase [Victivallales bacterium]
RRDLWIGASPALHADASSAPMLVVHDPDDSTVPYDQSLLLANALMAAGRPLRFLPSPGSGHGFVYNPGNTWTQNVWPLAVAWLDDHLLDAPSAELLEEDM